MLKKIIRGIIDRIKRWRQRLTSGAESGVEASPVLHRTAERDEVFAQVKTWQSLNAADRKGEAGTGIVAPALMGKSTFVKEDLLPTHARKKAGLKDSLLFVYIDVQHDGRVKDKVDLLIELRNRLHGHDVQTRLFDAALCRYAKLVGRGDLIRRLGGVRSWAEDEITFGGVLHGAVEAARKKLNAELKMILAGLLTTAAGAGAATVTFDSDAMLQAAVVAGAVLLAKGGAKSVFRGVEKHILEALCKGAGAEMEQMTGEQLQSILEGFLLLDIYLAEHEGENPRSVVVVFDSAEYLLQGYDRARRHAIPWAVSFAQAPAPYTLFCGKELTEELHHGKLVELLPVAEEAVRGYCRDRSVEDEDAISWVVRFSCGSPAIVRLLVDGITGANHEMGKNLAQKIKEADIDRSVDDWTPEKALSAILHRGFQGYTDEEMDAFFRLCWFNRWNLDLAKRAMPGFFVNDPDGYDAAFMSPMSYDVDSEGWKALHPTFETCLRACCSHSTVQVTMEDLANAKRLTGWNPFAYQAAQADAALKMRAFGQHFKNGGNP